MENRKITRQEQMCIAECIRRHWGEGSENTDLDIKEEQYQSCINNCNICG